MVSPSASAGRAAAPRRRWVRRGLGALLALVVLAVSVCGWVIHQNSYDLREEQVTITGGRQPLKGVLAWPKSGRGSYGLVVFVHGDGPIDATDKTFYRPIWEGFAKAGYASLSWNKPGVGGAPGNWLEQTMEDRAAETVAAVAWAKRRPAIDPRRIGLWGASQAGWVLPKVAVRLPELRFAIAVSPAVNWMQQGRYNLLAELKEQNASPAKVRAELARRDKTLELLRQDASFEQYKAAIGDPRGLTPDRWGFITKNYTSDASRDLAAMRVPVLLVLAGHDRNVDVADTEAGYRRALRTPGQLQIRHYPGAAHALVRKGIEDSKPKMLVVAVAAPRSLFAEGFLDDQRRYLQQVR
ncbi:CocE/NonD family hydrolase [Actinomadura vinacea]|uniref:CocE/NonD family hydrolase n=1 Tax=Actinomadura vinacea TaxID=115336 RepID=A0ABN3J1K7_9ACTN